jgi:hypothetical protein
MDAATAKSTAEAARQLYDQICQALTDSRGIHLETALTGAGYLAGAALLRMSGIDLSKLEPGAHVIVERVNEAGPILLEAMFDLCHRNGIDPAAPMPDAAPSDHQSLRDYPDLMQLLDPLFQQVAKTFQIPLDMQPYVAARAVAHIIIDGRANLAPGIAKAVATEAIVRSSKTVPPRPVTLP